ncbi:MAG: mobile mystery protein A [Saprospiraceae bacterium]|nr:mobile mystery protein A [Saprospiraceae bacterium]
MGKKSLQLQQLNNKMLSFVSLKQVAMPPTGWIKAIRNAIGMSMQQLGNKLNVSKQGVMDIEKREKEGSITIKSLREIARVMDMQLVYGFVPNDGSLDALIEKRATELAKQIVMRTANTMKLEDQANSKERIDIAIKERAADIKKRNAQILWN